MSMEEVLSTKYPFEPVEFKHEEGDFEYFESNYELCRYIRFNAVSEDPVLEQFELLGYRKGSITLAIKGFNEKFKSYLENHLGITFDPTEKSYFERDINKIQKLFDIIVKNGSFEEKDSPLIDKIRSIINTVLERGYYKKHGRARVNPLLENTYSWINRSQIFKFTPFSATRMQQMSNVIYPMLVTALLIDTAIFNIAKALSTNK